MLKRPVCFFSWKMIEMQHHTGVIAGEMREQGIRRRRMSNRTTQAIKCHRQQKKDRHNRKTQVGQFTKNDTHLNESHQPAPTSSISFKCNGCKVTGSRRRRVNRQATTVPQSTGRMRTQCRARSASSSARQRTSSEGSGSSSGVHWQQAEHRANGVIRQYFHWTVPVLLLPLQCCLFR